MNAEHDCYEADTVIIMQLPHRGRPGAGVCLECGKRFELWFRTTTAPKPESEEEDNGDEEPPAGDIVHLTTQPAYRLSVIGSLDNLRDCVLGKVNLRYKAARY